jgi:hypothetical protein
MVLNVHAPAEVESDDTKDILYEELDYVFTQDWRQSPDMEATHKCIE